MGGAQQSHGFETVVASEIVPLKGIAFGLGEFSGDVALDASGDGKALAGHYASWVSSGPRVDRDSGCSRSTILRSARDLRWRTSSALMPTCPAISPGLKPSIRVSQSMRRSPGSRLSISLRADSTNSRSCS